MMNTDRLAGGSASRACMMITRSRAEGGIVFSKVDPSLSSEASLETIEFNEGMVRFWRRNCISAQLTTTRYSQVLNFDSHRNEGKLRKRRINTSCARSSASAQFRVMCQHQERTVAA